MRFRHFLRQKSKLPSLLDKDGTFTSELSQPPKSNEMRGRQTAIDVAKLS